VETAELFALAVIDPAVIGELREEPRGGAS
jgi:hypothetical protein